MRIAIGLLWPILALWGRYSGNLMFNVPAMRPRAFTGPWGTGLFLFLNTPILLSPLTGIIWIFRTFPFEVALLIIAGGLVLGFITYSLVGIIGGVVGVFLSSSLILFILHEVAWGLLRPLSARAMSGTAALGLAYVITSAVRVWWDWREPYSNHPQYLRSANPLAILAAALTWPLWTFNLPWMDLRYTKEIHPDTWRFIVTMWLVFIGLSVLLASV